jgi:hypothetical protein
MNQLRLINAVDLQQWQKTIIKSLRDKLGLDLPLFMPQLLTDSDNAFSFNIVSNEDCY